MRNIVSPLDGIRSPFGRRGLSAYAIGNFDPALVADFDDEYYRANRQKTTFDGLLTHSRLSRATMVDSDGLIKWGPHNLLTYSEQFDNAAWTKNAVTVTANHSGDYFTLTAKAGSSNHWVYNGSPSGQIIVGIEAKAGTVGWLSISASGVPTDGAYFDLTNGVKGTEKGSDTASITPLSDGWYYCEVVFASNESFATFCIHTADDQSPSWTALGTETILVRRPRCIRKGLGGMVNNPDRGDSYVPTTDSPRYLPRRGHHVYNGSAYVNEGLLVESESRTNLITQSNAFTTTWTDSNATPASAAATGPDGETSMWNLVDDGSTGTGEVYLDFAATVAVDTTYTFSAYVKANDLSWCALGTENFTTPGNVETYFDLSTGAVGTEGTGHTANISDEGGGIYRVSITFTTDSSDTSGNVRIYVADADTDNTVDLDGTSSIYVYGAQLEAGSTPSSYIPTNGATATRGAETLTVAAADLPWPTPKVIGPELVTNGTFDTDTDWTKGTGWSISGGVATHDETAGAGDITQSLALTSGKVYVLSWDVTSGDGGSIYPAIGGTYPAAFNGNVGSYNHTFTASGTMNIGVRGSSIFTGSIDNISVREIDPLAVSIQMDGRVTFADTDVASDVDGGVGEAVFHLWKSGTSAYIETVLDTDNGTGMASFVQEGGGARDVVSSTGSYYTPGVLVPYNISSRHGSTFVNGAVDGVALTADTTPVALPDLSSTNLSLAYDYMGTIRQFRMWAADLGDTGIAEASEGEPSSYLIWDASADTYIQKVYD